MKAKDIIYRAWNPNLQRMYYDISLEGLSHLRSYKMEGTEIGLQLTYDFDNLVWMQKTSKMSQKGDYIHVGDVIQINPHTLPPKIGQVKFNEKMGAFTVCDELLQNFDPKNIIKLGNIYQDKKLAKVFK